MYLGAHILLPEGYDEHPPHLAIDPLASAVKTASSDAARQVAPCGVGLFGQNAESSGESISIIGLHLCLLMQQ